MMGILDGYVICRASSARRDGVSTRYCGQLGCKRALDGYLMGGAGEEYP